MDQYQEIHDLLLSRSTAANINLVFQTEDGKEIPLNAAAIEVLNNILEQAFIPFITQVLVDEGYHK